MPGPQDQSCTLSRRRVERDYRSAGLRDICTIPCGFFPPQILNRLAAARSIERRLEQTRWLSGLLPFILLCARAPADEPENET